MFRFPQNPLDVLYLMGVSPIFLLQEIPMFGCALAFAVILVESRSLLSPLTGDRTSAGRPEMLGLFIWVFISRWLERGAIGGWGWRDEMLGNY